MNFLVANGFLINKVLINTLTVWLLASVIKVVLDYIKKRRWNWALFFQTGGMPSTHSALVSGLAHSIGLYQGFSSPLFAISFVLAMIVIYDATGIRRQAGRHATVINKMIEDLATGHPLKEEVLREVLGHSPLEALVGALWGILGATLLWLIW
jgi:hypothetical protein